VRLGISNLAWRREEDAELVSELGGLGVDALEVAPTKLWDEPLAVPAETLAAYRGEVGLPIVALQALLFGHPELRLFDASRDATLAHLRGMCDVAAGLGAGVLVFGSPRNRQRGALAPDEACELAVAFFRELGAYAAERSVCVCVEPLPAELDTDFVNTAAEAAELVRAVDSPGIGLHLDSSSLHLNGEDPLEAIGPGLRHFHASDVGYDVLGTTGVDHARCAEALRRAGYEGVVSAEVLAGEGSNRDRVLASVDHARRIYG
jgi:D-psicose/D-tagatose/L-ribulose 3-epimerase